MLEGSERGVFDIVWSSTLLAKVILKHLSIGEMKAFRCASKLFAKTARPCFFENATFKSSEIGDETFDAHASVKRLTLNCFVRSNFLLGFPNLTELNVGRYVDTMKGMREIFDPKHLPLSLTKVVFHRWIGNEEGVHLLPKGLLYLNTGKSFDTPVDRLPQTLSTLILGRDFNHPVDHLPQTLTTLILGRDFNKPVDRLPPTLVKIEFGSYFDQPVDRLPLTIVEIKFDYFFNQPVDNLPPSVKEIKFGFCFNQPVDHLPPSLRCLIFGDSFNRPVDRLPLGLKVLSFGIAFFQRIDSLEAMRLEKATVPKKLAEWFGVPSNFPPYFDSSVTPQGIFWEYRMRK